MSNEEQQNPPGNEPTPPREEPIIIIERDTEPANPEADTTASEPAGESAPESTPESSAPEPPERADDVPGDESPKRRDVPIELLLFFLPTLLFFCYLLVPIYLRSEAALRYPFELDGEEGFVFLDAVQMRLGRPVYQPIAEEPFTVGNYPPLFAWIVARTMDPERMGLTSARLIVALSGILIAQLLILITYTQTRRLLPTFLAPLMFLVTYEFHHWSAFARVDLPALAFTLMGLYLFVAGRAKWLTSLSAVFFVLAAYTRVTSILAPAACCVSMLIWDRRRLAWFLVPYLGLGFGALAVINAATGGEFFTHVVRYNQNEMDWGAFRAVMKNEIWFFYRYWIVAIALGAAMLGAAALARRQPDEDRGAKVRGTSMPHARGVLFTYFMLAAASLLTFAKIGSAPNYALEPLAAAALFGMETLGRLCDAAGGQKAARRLVARIGVAAMAIALLAHTWHVHTDLIVQAMFSSRDPGKRDIEVGRAVLEAVRSAHGDVMTEYPVFSVIAGKPVTYEPFIMSRLAAEGKWDGQKIIEQVGRQRFGLIVTSEDLREVEKGARLWRYTPAVARTILRHYSLEYVVQSPTLRAVYLWLPRPVTAESEIEFIANTGRIEPSEIKRNRINSASARDRALSSRELLLRPHRSHSAIRPLPANKA